MIELIILWAAFVVGAASAFGAGWSIAGGEGRKALFCAAASLLCALVIVRSAA